MDEKWRKSNTQGWWLIHTFVPLHTDALSLTPLALPSPGILASPQVSKIVLPCWFFISHSCDSALSLSLSEWELRIIFFGSTYTRDFHLDNLQKSQYSMLSKRHLSSPHIPLLQCSCNRSTLPSVGSSAPYWSIPPFIHHLRSFTKSWVIQF